MMNDIFNQFSVEEYYKLFYARLHKMYVNKEIILIPGNVPSLKNSKEIIQKYTGKSKCCGKPYIKLGTGQFRCTNCDKMCEAQKLPSLISSKQVQSYLSSTTAYYLQARVDMLRLTKNWEPWMKKPLKIGLFYIRNSERAFDFDNASQIIQDKFRDLQIIEDDNMLNLVTYTLGYIVDKKFSGIFIVPLKEFPKFGL